MSKPTNPLGGVTIPNPNHESLLPIQQLAYDFLNTNSATIYDRTTQKPNPVPYTVLPTPVLQPLVDKMWSTHSMFQQIYATIATDHDFLLQHLSPLAQNDEYLTMLLDTLKLNYKRTDSPVCLLSRNDYMIHEKDIRDDIIIDDDDDDDDGIIEYDNNNNNDNNNNDNNNNKNKDISQSNNTNKNTTIPNYSQLSTPTIINGIQYTPQQVEFNTMSVGLISISHRVQKLHQYLLPSTQLYLNPIQNSSYLSNNGTFLPHDGSNGVAATLAVGVKHVEDGFDILQSDHITTTSTTTSTGYQSRSSSLDTSNTTNVTDRSNTLLEKNTNFIPNTPNKWQGRHAVLFVVQKVEFNIPDQRLIEQALMENHGIPVIRATFDDIMQNVTYINCTAKSHIDISIDNDNADNDSNNNDRTKIAKIPMWKNTIPIGVIYYRSCYTPRDFCMDDKYSPNNNTNDSNNNSSNQNLDENDTINKNSRKNALIQIYRDLESSIAVKCPNVGLFLSGMKKIQQVLTDKNVLSEFISRINMHNNTDNPNNTNEIITPEMLSNQINTIHQLSTDIYSLNFDSCDGETISSSSNHHQISNPSLQTIIDTALLNPNEWIIKPMREGGGNNLYNDDLITALKNKTEGNSVLMRKIITNPHLYHTMIGNDPNSIDNVQFDSTIPEYGIIGGLFAVIGNSNNNDNMTNTNINEPTQSNKMCTNNTNTLTIKHNTTFGTLVRIKKYGSNEGGLAIGKAYLSSLLTVPVSYVMDNQ